MKSPSYTQIANSFAIWREYVDPSNVGTEAEFRSQTEAEKIAFLTQCFGPEPRFSVRVGSQYHVGFMQPMTDDLAKAAKFSGVEAAMIETALSRRHEDVEVVPALRQIGPMKAGDLPLIGAAVMCDLCVGWTEGDGSGHEGYNVADYFDFQGRYKGPDEHGIEPIFREMTPDEVSEYFADEIPMPKVTE
jgi:hypothetical protein